ncbi:DUF3795 domain-containing protein [candidate division WOR-3 bacterium]|nr:DUF3795 domain-containing protein [candidate division WOR-3 bacterium]
MIAFCGMNCAECPAYLAHVNDDDDLREKTAEEWSQMFQGTFKPEDINCAGCVSTKGVHVRYCGECPVRLCGIQKGVENCAHCDEYPCEKLTKHFDKVAPGAKKTLDEIRKNLK